MFKAFIAFVRGTLVRNALLDGTTGLAGILSTLSTIITSLLTAMSSLTGWILSDDLAIMFFAVMFLMLAIHLIHSLVHKFS